MAKWAGEALGIVQRRRIVDQPAEPGEQSAAGGGQTVVAQTASVATVAQREAGLQGVLHLAGPPAVGMILQQMLTTSPQVLQTGLMHCDAAPVTLTAPPQSGSRAAGARSDAASPCGSPVRHAVARAPGPVAR